MATEIKMPALSPTMETGTLAKWLVAEGDQVRSGDVIAEIETDKTTMEVETIDDGIVGKLLVPAGAENVPVNTVIAILIDDADDSIAGASITDDSIADVAVVDKAAPENAALESAAPATVSAPAITEAAEIGGFIGVSRDGFRQHINFHTTEWLGGLNEPLHFLDLVLLI